MKAVAIIALCLAAFAVASPITRVQRQLVPAKVISANEYATLSMLESHSTQKFEAASDAERAEMLAHAQAQMSAISELIAKVGGGGVASSEKALKAANRGGGKPAAMVAQSMYAALTAWGLPLSSNWWIHSGTASFFYGIRGAGTSTEGGPMSDVDCHVHPLSAHTGKGAVGHRETAGGNGLIHVDAYDPCVDLGQQWAQDIERAVASSQVFCTIPAFIKATPTSAESSWPIKVITLNQLYHEYATIVRKAEKPNDKVTREAAVKLGATTGATDYLSKD